MTLIDYKIDTKAALQESIKQIEKEMDGCNHFIESYKNSEQESSEWDSYNYWIGRHEGYRKTIKILKQAFDLYF